MLSNRVVGSDAVAETALLGNKQKTQADRIPKWIQNSSTAVGPDRLDHNESTRRTSNICTSKNGNLVCIIGTQCCLWSYIISAAVVTGMGFFGCPEPSYQTTGITTAALLGVLTLITLMCLCPVASLGDFSKKLYQYTVGSLVVILLSLIFADFIYTLILVPINCEFTISIIIIAIGISYGILLCICCYFEVVASGNP
jgi:hypothetical protein